MEINNICQGRQNIVPDDYKINISNIGGVETHNQHNDLVNQKKLEEKDVKDIAEGLNKLIEHTKTHVQYEKHDKFNDYIIKIIDDKTGDVLKEIPPKKILDMIAQMCENLGIFIDSRA